MAQNLNVTDNKTDLFIKEEHLSDDDKDQLVPKEAELWVNEEVVKEEYTNKQPYENKLRLNRTTNCVIKVEIEVDLQHPKLAVTLEETEVKEKTLNEGIFCTAVPVSDSSSFLTASSTICCPVYNKQCQGESNIIDQQLHSELLLHTCNTCGEKFKSCVILKTHILKEHTKNAPYNCSICKKGFVCNNNLTIHMQTHAVEKPYSCSVCPEKFRKRTELDRHSLIHSKETPYNCDICEEKFKSQNERKEHTIKIHSKDFPCKCGICGKGFLHIGHLQLHVNSHSDEKPFSCTVCKKKFKRKQNLNNHLLTHSQKKSYTCDICKEKLKSSKDMNAHTIRAHTNSFPHKCSFCGKGFLLRSELRIHLRYHTNERAFSCSTCQKKFYKKSHLERHSLIHSKETPYKCNICGSQFKTQDNLKIHTRRKHTRDYSFNCNICGKGYFVNREFQLHVLSHADKKPLSCSVCEKKFDKKITLSHHLLSHIKEGRL